MKRVILVLAAVVMVSGCDSPPRFWMTNTGSRTADVRLTWTTRFKDEKPHPINVTLEPGQAYALRDVMGPNSIDLRVNIFEKVWSQHLGPEDIPETIQTYSLSGPEAQLSLGDSSARIYLITESRFDDRIRFAMGSAAVAIVLVVIIAASSWFRRKPGNPPF